MDDAFFGDFTLAAAAPASAPPSPEAVAEESSLVLDGIERAASLTTTGLALHPRMAGKLGSGRHGCSAERKLLSIHMHRCNERAKFAKSIGKLEDFVAGMKSVCRLRKSRAGKLNLKTNKFTRKTIAKPMTGNRHNDVIDPSWYLACAFRDVKIPNVSKPTHSCHSVTHSCKCCSLAQKSECCAHNCEAQMGRGIQALEASTQP